MPTRRTHKKGRSAARRRQARILALARQFLAVLRAEPMPRTEGELEEREQRRSAARHKARNAIAAGRIAKKPCAACGTTRTLEAHHTDYSRPLDVVFVCYGCHKEIHALAPDRARAAVADEDWADSGGHGMCVELPGGGSIYAVDGEPEDVGDADAWNALEGLEDDCA